MRTILALVIAVIATNLLTLAAVYATYEFDVPMAKAQPMEAYEPGTCPECKAPILMHLKRTQLRQ